MRLSVLCSVCSLHFICGISEFRKKSNDYVKYCHKKGWYMEVLERVTFSKVRS
ncbi:hypothetical protein MIDIC_550005 [Alphaproteobacteria bacterium]